MTGTLLAVPLTATGLKAPTHPILKFPFIGPGPNLERQESSHPHQVYQRSSSEILIPDLGADKIWRLAPSASGEWEIKGEVACASGAGPRHVQLVASDLYVLNELNNTLSHYTLPGGLGTTASVRTTQPCTLLPTPPGAGAAELLLHPAGKYLYATNRDSGDAKGDTIAIFKLEASVLALGAKEPKWVKEVHTGLEHIRGAVIKELDGKVWLIAAGVKGGGIKVFEVVGGENLVEVAHAAIEKVTGFAWL
ncbi:hypothetical protein DACRYDRAFT_22957 [Dacryopinax primogenitus]|uniref:Isomerase YbhE n=1 Tax=Dacryopinax primogenitus (strain DJM 731) TaxID=1858805 RepID=M5G5Z6_DACPD|nr:uncharacterized protein DACRYDRAFT_22957 [Dacryopinax primogenitus]EJU01222.1 hypothetical protein DACRYDRAFT_22957 [Dacryopinax primogenitus]